MRLRRIQTGLCLSHKPNRPTTDLLLHSVINRFRGEDSDLLLITEDWPTYLDDERVGWNQNNVRKGLFRGHVLVRVSPTITHTTTLQLPISVQVALQLFRNKTATQANKIDGWYNAKLKAKGPKDFLKRQHITRVTPEMIAYAALQVFSAVYCTTVLMLPSSADIHWAFLHEAVG